jgi:excisionase family DNA binding protein
MRTDSNNVNNFLTVDEAALLVGMSHWTVRRWLDLGKLTRYKSASRTFVSRSELLELLKPRKVRELSHESYRCH